MDKTVFVQKVDSRNSLDEEVESSVFIKVTLLFDQSKQVALRNILHNEVYIVFVLEVSVHSHDIDML